MRDSVMTRRCLRLLALLGLATHAFAQSPPAQSPMPTCRDDAMIVFDASGSMAGTDLNGPLGPRIAKVRRALAQVLPSVSERRNLGLIDYGPGPYNRCDNIELQLEPTPNADRLIMSVVDKLVPARRTPLTEAVRRATDVLKFPSKSGVVVLLTDGEETCGGDPCSLARSLIAKGRHLAPVTPARREVIPASRAATIIPPSHPAEGSCSRRPASRVGCRSGTLAVTCGGLPEARRAHPVRVREGETSETPRVCP